MFSNPAMRIGKEAKNSGQKLNPVNTGAHCIGAAKFYIL